MKKILLLNGGKRFAHSDGRLNQTLHDAALAHLDRAGFDVRETSQKYGSGGLVQGKQYMLSLTWNAPQQAFDDPSDFFEGKGVDAVYFPFHKANQFLGMSGLPTFLAVDVMKRPDVPAALAAYEQHLDQVFGKAQ